MKLNNTPVRTSRNFNINNINVDLQIPSNLKKFEKFSINKNVMPLKEDLSFKYGVGLDLEANNSMQINLEDKDNVKLIYNLDDENLNLVNKIYINAKGNSTITIQYNSLTNKKGLHNGFIKLVSEENSNVNINIVNFLNEEIDNLESFENVLKDNSSVNCTVVDFGGKTSITNYYSNLQGEGSKFDIKTIYMGNENQVKDINYIAELYGKKTFTDIDLQGALSDNAVKHFKGTIDFKKGCKNSKGAENEFCLLLSDNAKSIALPMLLCSEEDVEGNHSTSSGKLDADKMFYIMSRGLNRKKAIELIVKANFSVILERIKDEELKDKIMDEIDKKLK